MKQFVVLKTLYLKGWKEEECLNLKLINTYIFLV